MATILRTRKFINFFTGYHLKIYQSNFSPLKFVFKSNYETLHPHKYYSTAVVINFIDKPEKTLAEVLRHIDVNYHYNHRITYDDIKKVLKFYDSTSISTESVYSDILLQEYIKMLIHCCGKAMIYEIPSSKSKLLNRLWQIYKNKGFPLSLPLYNALLSVYLENGQDFSPAEILLEMSNNNIQPDAFTYKYILRKYCEKGNIEEAYRILNFIKENEIYICSNIFSSLIIGNSEANNIEEAENILNIMRDMKRKPSSQIYAALLVAYAKKGDLNNILETLNYCDSVGISILDTYKMDIVYSLALNGHENHIDKILSLFSWDLKFDSDNINFMAKLMDIKAVNVAMKVLLAAKKAGISEYRLSNIVDLVATNIVKLELPEEKIIESLNVLEKEGFKVYSNSLLECAKIRMTKYYIPLLKAWSKIGFKVKEPIFWPLLANIGSENVKGVFEVVHLMKNEFKIKPSFVTLTNFVLVYTKNRNSDVIDTLIHDCKISAELIVNAVLYYELSNNEIENAVKCIKNSAKYTVKYNSELLSPVLENALQKTNDLTSYNLIKAEIEGKQRIEDQRELGHKRFENSSVLNSVCNEFKLKEYSEKGDLNNAENYLRKIRNNHLCKLSADKWSCYVGLLVKNDKRADIKQILKDFENGKGLYFLKTREKQNKCMKSLELMAEKGYVEETNQFYNILLKGNWSFPTNFTGPLVQVHLVQNNLKAALKTVEKIGKEYRYIPAQIELMKILIEAEEIDPLQWLTDFSIKCHGESRTILSLAVAFLKTQRLRQCKRMLESQRVPLNDNVVSHYISNLLVENDVSLVKDLINVTQGLDSVNRNILYQHLLEKYSLLNNCQEALALLNQMQNEKIIPSESFLLILSELLQRNDLPVPFLLTNSTIYLEEKDDFYSKVIKMYLRDQLRPHKAYLDYLERNLVEVGNIKTIELIEDKWKQLFSRYQGKQFLKFEACIRSNKVDSYLKQIEEWISSDKNEIKDFIPNPSTVKYLLSYPEIIDSFESLASKIYLRYKHAKPLLAVLSYYLIKDDPRSKFIFNEIGETPWELYNTYFFIVNSFVVTDNFDQLPKLAEILHKYKPTRKRYFYEAFLTVYEEQNKLEEGIQVLNKLKAQEKEANEVKEENNYSTLNKFLLAL